MLLMSCNKKEGTNIPAGVVFGDQTMKDNGKTIAFIGFFAFVNKQQKPKKPTGPIVALLDRDKATLDEGAIIRYNNTFYTMLNGEKVLLTQSTGIIYNSSDKTYERFNLSNITDDRLDFIKSKITEANKKKSRD